MSPPTTSTVDPEARGMGMGLDTEKMVEERN